MSKLMEDRSAGARAVTVPCMDCGKRFRLAAMTCDLEGPAFRAYHCPTCADIRWPRPRTVERVEFDQQRRAVRRV